MPYESYTNDSDAQLAAQIDRFKLGPGVSPGGSAFWASEAAMNSLGNDQMNVARLMEARARLGASSMATRQSISGDRMNQQDSNEFDSYSAMMRDGFSGDPVKDAALRQKALLDFSGNERVSKSVATLASADADQVQARGFKSQIREFDEEDANWETDTEIQRLKRGNDLKAMRSEGKRLDLLADSMDEQIYGIVQDQAGSLMERSGPLAAKVAKVGHYLDDAGDYRTARALGAVTANFSRSTLLENSYRSEIEVFAPHIAKINSYIGKDISSAKTPEEYDQMLALTKEKTSHLPEKEQQNIQKALEAHGNLMGSQIRRSKLEADFTAHMDKAPTNMASPDAQEWKAGLAALNAEASFIGGIVTKKEAEIAQRQERDDRSYETRKRSLEIIDKVQDIKFDAEDQTLQRISQEWEMAKVPRSEQFRIVMAASKGKLTPAQGEKLVDTLQAKWAENPASKTNTGSLYPKR